MTGVTTWIIIISSLVWIAWDIYLYAKRRNDKSVKTISMIITEFSWYSPMAPFIAGLLCGHWWWT